MTTISVHRGPVENRILLLQLATLIWMLVECSPALTAAWRARSVSLLAFGSDSLVELISAVVVLLQFTPLFRISQVKAAQFSGTLLFSLAALVGIWTIGPHVYMRTRLPSCGRKSSTSCARAL